MRTPKTRLSVIAASILLIVALVLATALLIASRHERFAADGDSEAALQREGAAKDTALDTSGARSKGMALFSRAADLARLGDTSGALAAFEQAVGEWEERPWSVPEEMRRRGRLFGKQLTLLSLENGDAAQALRSLSAGARASGRPVSALEELHARLDVAARDALWPESPFISLTSFIAGNTPGPILFGAAENTVFEVSIEPSGEMQSPCAVISVSSGEGRPCFGLPAVVDLPSGTFGFRARVRADKPVPISMALRFWLPREKKELIYLPTAVHRVDSTWTWLAVEDDFLKYCYDGARAAGLDMSDAYIDRAGIAVPGEPNTFWIDRLELYLPGLEGHPAKPENTEAVPMPGKPVE
ncbi:MAG TPA: hypothetical protein PKW60_13690 [Candidatus Hydrogenedentes bacterium]|nr:hypothetical protein [Candidatus Hydrogenedentota bacterium]